MKKIYALMLALLPLSATAGEVKVTTPSLFLKNDTLTLDFRFDVSDVTVNSTQAYAFTPVLSRDWHYYSLPPVVVSGKKSFKMRRADRKIARNGEYDAPYTVIYGKDKNRDNIVNYRLQLPYQQWMDDMDMIILQEGKESCVIDLPAIEIYKPKPVEKPKPLLPAQGQFCQSCIGMVSFFTPREKPLKTHSMQNTLYVEYPVGGTKFQPDYKNNTREVQKLRDALAPLMEGKNLISFKAIRICGYASPDGSVKTNERMASARAKSFADNLKTHYPFPDSLVRVTSGGEDWDELVRLLEEKQPAYADKALEVIDQYDNLDTREARLKTALGASYRTMVNELFPSLRRITVAVDYEIREVRNNEAAELIHTHPEMLNLDEILSVAKLYKPGSKEYREVYEIAVTRYPEDAVANINAASAQIIYGDFQRAQRYMDRVKDDPRAWNNLGVLSWLRGETEVAKVWFEKAMQSEPEKAKANLEKMAAYE